MVTIANRMTLVVLLMFVCFSVALGQGDGGYWPTDTWRVSTPEEQGMDSAQLVKMFQWVQEKDLNIHSMLIVKNGYLVTEAYFAPYNRDVKHPLFSATKSITSALVGLALQEGYFKNLTEKVSDYFTPDGLVVRDPRKNSITLKHLLTMSSGFQSLSTFQILQSPNPALFVLDKPLQDAPGSLFKYNTSTVHVLAAILKKVSGKNPQTYAGDKIFGPLGFNNITWDTDPNGLNLGGTGLQLTPLEMAKYGYLYLREGLWNGCQILPRDWVRESTRKQIDTPYMNDAEQFGYGYLWWMNSFGGFSAHGFGGQYIFVLPAQDMVVVFTSGLSDQLFATPYQLMEKYIIPAVKTKQALSPNERTQAALMNIIKQLRDSDCKPASYFPEVAQTMTGKTFLCEKNALDFSSLSFELNKVDAGLVEVAYTNQPDKTYAIPVGMDDVYRQSGDPSQATYAKGKWLDDNTFELIMHEGVAKLKLTFKFDGMFVKAAVNSEMYGIREEFKAKLKD